MRDRKIIAGAAALGVAVLLAAYFLIPRAVTDDQRYAELQRLGKMYKATRAARPLPDRIAALLHFTSPTRYLRSRFDEQEKALVSSGYLVEITIHVQNLSAKRGQVKTMLSNTWAQTDAYYVATLDKTQDEVTLLCRKQDISLWKSAFKNAQEE